VRNYTDWRGILEDPAAIPDSCCDGPNCGSQGTNTVAYDVVSLNSITNRCAYGRVGQCYKVYTVVFGVVVHRVPCFCNIMSHCFIK